jgi:hypothetical protein
MRLTNEEIGTYAAKFKEASHDRTGDKARALVADWTGRYGTVRGAKLRKELIDQVRWLQSQGKW